jgi:hypothetical protein
MTTDPKSHPKTGRTSPLDSIPPAEVIRARLTALNHEASALRSLLRLVLRRERSQGQGLAGSQEARHAS